MPMLLIQTNTEIARDAADALLKEASRLVAETLGKPERYVMVAIEDKTPMSFAGDTAPLAYLELKSIGLLESQTEGASAALCGLIGERLEIPADRIYIEFADAPRKMWGWNGGTF